MQEERLVFAENFLRGVEVESGLGEAVVDWGGSKSSTAREHIKSAVYYISKQLDEPNAAVSADQFYHSLKNALLLRLKVIQEYRRAALENELREIDAPVFIIGMSRTGSTFSHSLIETDPHNRSPLLWEMRSPACDVEVDERISTTREWVASRVTPSPIIQQMHYENELKTDECTQVLELQAFFLELVCCGASPYWDWLLTLPVEQQAEVFYFHKQVMQVLQYQFEQRAVDGASMSNTAHKYWTFKSPCYSRFMDAIKMAYPTAKFMWVHRDPKKVMDSVCLLTREFAKLFVPNFDEYCVNGGLRARYDNMLTFQGSLAIEAGRTTERWEAEGKGDDVVHLQYTDLVADPIRFMASAYEKLGREFTMEFKNAIDEYMAADKDRRKPIAVTQSAPFTAEEVAAVMGDYTRKFVK
jgi:hypothetical protein